MSSGVVEFLTFSVAAADRSEWLAADERVWTAFLREQPGFVSKQVWTDRDDPDVVHAVITWSDEQAWNAISAEDLARTDEEMGAWRRPLVMRVFDLARQT